MSLFQLLELWKIVLGGAAEVDMGGRLSWTWWGAEAMYGEKRKLVTDQLIEIDIQPVELECLRIFYRLKN